MIKNKTKRLHATIVSASENFVVIKLKFPSNMPKVGDNLVVSVPSEAKVEMISHSLKSPRVTDTIARGRIIRVAEDMLTIKPLKSRTDITELQSLAATNTSVGVSAIMNRIKVH